MVTKSCVDNGFDSTKSQKGEILSLLVSLCCQPLLSVFYKERKKTNQERQANIPWLLRDNSFWDKEVTLSFHQYQNPCWWPVFNLFTTCLASPCIQSCQLLTYWQKLPQCIYLIKVCNPNFGKVYESQRLVAPSPLGHRRLWPGVALWAKENLAALAAVQHLGPECSSAEAD